MRWTTFNSKRFHKRYLRNMSVYNFFFILPHIHSRHQLGYTGIILTLYRNHHIWNLNSSPLPSLLLTLKLLMPSDGSLTCLLGVSNSMWQTSDGNCHNSDRQLCLMDALQGLRYQLPLSRKFWQFCEHWWSAAMFLTVFTMPNDRVWNTAQSFSVLVFPALLCPYFFSLIHRYLNPFKYVSA